MKWPSRIFVMLTAVALFGCSTLPPAPTSPSMLAQSTFIDERALLGAEISYKAARIMMEAAVDNGRIAPGQAAKFFRLNGKLNEALVRCRKAYDAANAPGYQAALDEAGPLISELWEMASRQESKHGR